MTTESSRSAHVFSPAANAIRALAMDAVQQANSGHPGMPMGMAEIAQVLWQRHLHHNPANPQWSNRDRFVVSNGHGSMLIYALLHLTGYDLPLEELKRFRQLHSKTPGHPEFGLTPGVETTTGPLGQGICNAVGFALAEKLLAHEFNRDMHRIVDHYTYVFLGDGCLMEGVSHEACSLAGTWGLNKLIALYDDNGISIDGKIDGWFTDDTPKRFEAYGWNVIRAIDGHNPDAIHAAIEQAKGQTDKPTLICCKTVIGMGSPKRAGTAKAHGEPLGVEEIAATREAIGWAHPAFVIPDEIYAQWDAKVQGNAFETHWNQIFAAYASTYPELAAEYKRRMAGELPAHWEEHVNSILTQLNTKADNVASRKASQIAIEAFAPKLPELIGGSADLAGSNLTIWSGSKGVSKTEGGNYLYFGVREFGMTAIANGIALHGGYLPYTATFLVFSDYARNAIRMAALMKQRHVMVFTHDSIGLGEDGPTHQPIEHAASLRLIPNLDVWRPCDTVETACAWVYAIERNNGPSALLLSRQNLPHCERRAEQINGIRRGGYILEDAPDAQALIIATGSEVQLALGAQKKLAADGIAVRVVSMPSSDVFDRQDVAYRTAILGGNLPRIAIEAGATAHWYKYVGSNGKVLGIDTFGESAPAGELFKHFGLTVEHLIVEVKDLLSSL